MTRKRTRAELETALAKAERSNIAFQEWWMCSVKGFPEKTFVAKTTGLAEVELRVLGASRASGGVAVVAVGEFRDQPRLLDDVLAEWATDPELAPAARAASAWRDEELSRKTA